MTNNDYNIIRTAEFLPILESQRCEFFCSLEKKAQNGIIKLPYQDKNYSWKPYLVFTDLNVTY